MQDLEQDLDVLASYHPIGDRALQPQHPLSPLSPGKCRYLPAERCARWLQPLLHVRRVPMPYKIVAAIVEIQLD